MIVRSSPRPNPACGTVPKRRRSRYHQYAFGSRCSLGEPAIEIVEPLLALRAADDLADAGRQDVHRRHGLPVVVHAHVERLDLLRVVHHDDGRLDVLLGQPALVLGLQVHAPAHGKLERLAALLERGDRIGVRHALEARRDERLDARDAVLVDAVGEELHVVAALVQDAP